MRLIVLETALDALGLPSGLAILVAVNQIGIATTLVNTLFMGALALALGLASFASA